VAALAGSVCIGRCTLRALLGAEARGVESIAFPALGTGVGQVSAELCAGMMLEAVRTFAGLAPGRLRTVRIVLHSEKMMERFAAILSSM
jgi:O-acetyl-ADP-ribose deacetylase (regulator of RNase III)